MIIRPTWKSSRPSAFGLYAANVCWYVLVGFILYRLYELELPWEFVPLELRLGLFGLIFFVSILLIFAIIPLLREVSGTVSWEIAGKNLVHTMHSGEHFEYPIDSIESFSSSVLHSGLPSTRGRLSRGRVKWLKVGGKRVDKIGFPHAYSEKDWEAFKKALKKVNPKIQFGYTFK